MELCFQFLMHLARLPAVDYFYTVLRLRQSAAALSWKLGFYSRLVCVGFVEDKVAWGHVLLRALRFSPVSIISPVPHIHLSVSIVL